MNEFAKKIALLVFAGLVAIVAHLILLLMVMLPKLLTWFGEKLATMSNVALGVVVLVVIILLAVRLAGDPKWKYALFVLVIAATSMAGAHYLAGSNRSLDETKLLHEVRGLGGEFTKAKSVTYVQRNISDLSEIEISFKGTNVTTQAFVNTSFFGNVEITFTKYVDSVSIFSSENPEGIIVYDDESRENTKLRRNELGIYTPLIM
ncbi:hypothetical protein ACFL0K_03125 [Patescibacteria group bacterium]